MPRFHSRLSLKRPFRRPGAEGFCIPRARGRTSLPRRRRAFQPVGPASLGRLWSGTLSVHRAVQFGKYHISLFKRCQLIFPAAAPLDKYPLGVYYNNEISKVQWYEVK